MKSTASVIGCVVLAWATAGGNAQAAGPLENAPSQAPRAAATQAAPTHAMQALRESAQRLRESIRQLAQKPPGPERQVALDAARAALLQTQQAMLDLPPQDRAIGASGTAAGTPSGTAGYDASVRKLMAAADSLRDSIQDMATQAAGPRRNQAIRDANRALLETQGAMANAYDLTAFPSERTVALSPRTMDCVRLENMVACQRD